MWDLQDSCNNPTCSELRGSLTYRRFDDCLSRINAYFHRWARIGYRYMKLAEDWYTYQQSD